MFDKPSFATDSLEHGVNLMGKEKRGLSVIMQVCLHFRLILHAHKILDIIIATPCSRREKLYISSKSPIFEQVLEEKRATCMVCHVFSSSFTVSLRFQNCMVSSYKEARFREYEQHIMLGSFSRRNDQNGIKTEDASDR